MPVGIDQIARMRHQHVAGEAAVAIDAEMARLIAQMLFAALAAPARAAADPGIDGIEAVSRSMPVPLPALRIDVAADLVTEREGQLAPAADVELLAVAQIEIAVDADADRCGRGRNGSPCSRTSPPLRRGQGASRLRERRAVCDERL